MWDAGGPRQGPAQGRAEHVCFAGHPQPDQGGRPCRHAFAQGPAPGRARDAGCDRPGAPTLQVARGAGVRRGRPGRAAAGHAGRRQPLHRARLRGEGAAGLGHAALRLAQYRQCYRDGTQQHCKCAAEEAKENGKPPRCGLSQAPPGLGYFEIDSPEGAAYLGDMLWCQRYAYFNRQFMLERVAEIVSRVTRHDIDAPSTINIHHNYCRCETCTYTDPATGVEETRKLWITRKGATSAREGELGIIPGSMGTGSFITRGRGNPQSWNSSSHGAGRRLSRTEAKSKISQQDFERAMQGIVCETNTSLRDEAPAAYKDLTAVMRNQASLVDVVYRLLPLMNFKGK
eukprot:m.70975 g.70975  ORF g.70975 m.70975 type:complete len:343 (-) comp7616_c0_seq2:111-1139(-)